MSKSVFFLHIPKAAGTSINELFRPVFEKDRYFDHCESRGAGFTEKLGKQAASFYASGHLRFASVDPLIRNKNVFSLTCVRRPQEHLCSHLNWVRAYGAPDADERRKLIEPAIGQLATELWNTDFNDIAAMEPLMARPVSRGLFDNTQTRYLRAINHAKAVTGECVASAMGVFHAFDLVFTLDDYGHALKILSAKFAGLQNAGVKNRGKLNKKINFQDEQIAAFYEPFIQFDKQLVNGFRWKSRNHFFPHLVVNKKPAK